jgi:hypothetical protein
MARRCAEEIEQLLECYNTTSGRKPETVTRSCADDGWGTRAGKDTLHTEGICFLVVLVCSLTASFLYAISFYFFHPGVDSNKYSFVPFKNHFSSVVHVLESQGWLDVYDPFRMVMFH